MPVTDQGIPREYFDWLTAKNIEIIFADEA
jgi:hypothetical protein